MNTLAETRVSSAERTVLLVTTIPKSARAAPKTQISKLTELAFARKAFS